MKRAVMMTAAVLVAGAAAASQPVHARDFFSSFFGGFVERERPAPAPEARDSALPYADPNTPDAAAQQRPRSNTRASFSGGGGAYCVRTCDGRYFPLTGGGQSKAETCKSLCPASETKVVYGGDIDSASTESGKPYSSLPNAFRYRNEIVNGCTCNGQTTGGLARVDPQNDPTLRKGDLVAGPNSTLVASRSGSDGTSRTASYTPAPKRHRSPFFSIPVMAFE